MIPNRAGMTVRNFSTKFHKTSVHVSCVKFRKITDTCTKSVNHISDFRYTETLICLSLQNWGFTFIKIPVDILSL